MKIKLQQIVRSPLFSAGIILFVLLTARAFRVWSLGVYWDDWRILARGVERGAFEIFRYMAGERILMGASHATLFALFGPNPLAWHLTNLFLEFGIAVLIYALLRRLLPNKSPVPLLAACLFVAYPLSVIRMHMINVYINVAIVLAGLSLYLTSLAHGRDPSQISSTKRRIEIFAAAALIPIYLLSYEMPVGFEVVRLYILWAILSGPLAPSPSFRQRLFRLAKGYLPYALGLAVFVLGRAVAYPRFATGLGADLRPDTGIEALTFVGMTTSEWSPGPFKIVHTIFHTLVAPWLNAAARLTDMKPFSWTWTSAWFLSAAAMGVILVYGFCQRRLGPQNNGVALDSNDIGSWLQRFILSMAALGATLAPIWFHSSHTVQYQNLNSRNGYLATIPAGLVLLSLTGLLTSTFAEKEKAGNSLTIVAALLIALGVGYNSLLTDVWIEDWRRAQSTWRQILNRVPDIREGTLVVLSRPDDFKALGEPLRHRDIFEPAQLFYGIGYKGILGSPVVRASLFGPPRSILSWLGTGEWQTKRASVPFLLQPDGLLVGREQILILDECEGCLKALDSRRPIQDVNSPMLNSISHFSNTGVIVPPSEPGDHFRLRQILLRTAELTWCESYAKACWLREQKDWEGLVAVYRQTERHGLSPTNPIEWLPFVEALYRCEHYEAADNLLLWVRAASAYCQRAAREMLNNVLKDHKLLGRPVERLSHQINLLHINEEKAEAEAR